MADRKPKQRHIDCFVEIVQLGSIAAAAKRLSLTQPAVSRTLADLEDILQARLMERSRSGITLTPAGETFLRYATASASAIERGVNQVAQNRRSGRQAVNIGALPNVAARILPEAVRRFKTANHEIPVRIVAGTNRDLMQALRQGDLDFVVGRLAAPSDMAGLVFEPLFQEELVAVVRVGHPLMSYAGTEPIGRAIVAYPVLLPLTGTIVREDAEQLMIAVGATELEDVVETLSVDFGRAYVDKSDALWITPRGTVDRDLSQGRLSILPIDTAATRGTVGITLRQELRLSIFASKLVDVVRQVTKDC